MILYLFNFLNCRVFLQILSDISIQCKERAILLYKIFKLYFVEHEKKWIAVIHRLKNKIKHYKDLCEVIVANKFKNVDKIDEINKVLLNRHLSEGIQYYYVKRKFNFSQEHHSSIITRK